MTDNEFKNSLKERIENKDVSIYFNRHISLKPLNTGRTVADVSIIIDNKILTIPLDLPLSVDSLEYTISEYKRIAVNESKQSKHD